MKKWILFLAVIVMLPGLVIAKKKKKTSVKKAPVKTESTVFTKDSMAIRTKVENTDLPLCESLYGTPTWYLKVDKSFEFPTQMVHPANYRLVTVNDKFLTDYLKKIPAQKTDKTITIPLYINGTLNCYDYLIERVQTMDEVLQAKYPELMSFKITDKNNALNAGRIDCDGTSTKIMMNVNNETYFITPTVVKGITYYVCYAKSDPNLIKKPFEIK